MTWQFAAILGLVLNGTGVVGLFVFGMPFRLSLGEHAIVVVPNTDQREILVDRVYKGVAWLSLAAILVSVALQVYAVSMSPS